MLAAMYDVPLSVIDSRSTAVDNTTMKRGVEQETRGVIRHRGYAGYAKNQRRHTRTQARHNRVEAAIALL